MAPGLGRGRTLQRAGGGAGRVGRLDTQDLRPGLGECRPGGLGRALKLSEEVTVNNVTVTGAIVGGMMVSPLNRAEELRRVGTASVNQP